MLSPQQLEQRTPEWLLARKGKITASLAAACLGLDPYKGPLAAFNDITGRRKEPENKHMAWGVEFEQAARDAYEVESGNIVTATGFWVHPRLDWLGASPDGLIGSDGLCEIKCPSQPPTGIPSHHVIQMRVQMACADRAWCDYFSWNQNGHFLERLLRDEQCEGEILTGLEIWYRRFIEPDIAPPRSRRAKESPSF